MADPKGFLKYDRDEPSKRPAAERVGDWREFVLPLPELRVREQATRCMDCGVPFCHSPLHPPIQGDSPGSLTGTASGCPVENLIPEWNRLVSDGLWKEALQSLHSTNNFPEFTGKLCPAPCESACVLSINSSPVTIRAIESAIVENGFKNQWIKPQPATTRTGKKVAIVGSGPAGLAAAQQLARLGHDVSVYEKAKSLGGLLRYGIPDFKMEKNWIDRRLEQLSAEGITFYNEIEVGKNLSALDLCAQNDAVCLTLGAEEPRQLGIPGSHLAGIFFAMDYLTQQNQRVAGGNPTLPMIDANGKKVVILGGGDTGSDCLGTALRQGASSVVQIELMPRPPESVSSNTPWPDWPLKLRSSHAHEEGGQRDWSVVTRRFISDERPNDRGDEKAPRVRALECVRVEWSAEGNNAGFKEIVGSDFEVPADLVLIAAGFVGGRRYKLYEELGISLDRLGRLPVDRRFMTQKPGIFAAGDVKRGASLIVWAIAEGRKMAAFVDQYLETGNFKKQLLRNME